MSKHDKLGGGGDKATIYPEDSIEDAITFDASVSEVHSGMTKVTAHPVEGGSDITDHIQRSPDSITMSIVITNHPPIKDRDVDARPTYRGGDAQNRAEDSYAYLLRHKSEGTLLGIHTTLREYHSMVIQSLSVTRDSATGSALMADIVLREIIVATTEQVEAPAAPAPRSPERRGTTNKGKKQKTDPSAQTVEKSESALSSLFSAFGG